VGGVFAQYATWRWIFLINLPVGALSFVLALKHNPDLKEEDSNSFDFFGFTVLGLSVVSLSLGFERAPISPWLHTLISVGFGLALMDFYWSKLAKRKGAIIEASLFDKPNFLIGVCGNLCSRVGSGAMPFILPLYLQLALGFSPVKAGLFMVPQAFGSFIGKGLINFMLLKLGFRNFLILNTSCLGLLVASFSLIDGRTPEATMAVVFCVYGIINSMQFSALNSLILIDLDHRQAAPGNSLLSVVIQLCSNSGVSMGSGLLAVFALAVYGSSFRSELATVAIFQPSFFIIGLVILSAALVLKRLSGDLGVDSAGEWPHH
jgi:predicted MFS family arabinose efflux permease